MISDHPIIRKQLWAKVDFAECRSIGEVLLKSLLAIMAILTVGTAVEYLRTKIFYRVQEMVKR